MTGAPILQVITRLVRGGAARSLLATLRALHARGVPVVLASGPQTGPEGGFWDEARACPFPVHLVPDLVRRESPLQDWRGFWQLVALTRRVRPALVHTHTSKAGILGRAAAWWVGVRPIVHSNRGLIFGATGIPNVSGRPVAQAVFLALERLAARATDAVTALSAGEATRLVELGMARPGTAHVHPSPVDLSRFRLADAGTRAAARAACGLDPGTPVAIAVGRLTGEKGHAVLVSAWATVRARLPDAVCLIVGDGAEAPGLRAAAGPGVRFLGSREDVEAVLPAADLLVQPSLYEGQGVALLEAFATGLPVVASRVGGIPEVVTDGVDGDLVPPGDAPALADAVVALLTDAGRRATLAAAGRRTAARYAPEVAAERLVGLYRALRPDAC